MKRTVIGVFDRLADAQRAADRIAGLGIERERIHIKTAARQFGDAEAAAPEHEVLDGIRSFFAEIFGPDLSTDDPRRYTEAIQSGSVVVAVEIHQASELEMVRHSLYGSGASRLGGSDPEAGGATDDDDDASPRMRRCIEACRACHKTCLQLAMTRCLELDGKHLEPEHFRLLLNCAEICHTTANFMISRSHLHPLLCGVCAEVCANCARSCDAVGDMAGCVEQCRDCGARCREIAEAAA